MHTDGTSSDKYCHYSNGSNGGDKINREAPLHSMYKESWVAWRVL